MIAAGDLTTCALSNGRVSCWGGLGDGRRGTVDVLDGAIEIAGGGDRFCAVVDAGAVNCWSAADTRSHAVPIEGVVEISVAQRHACAIKRDQSVWCWDSDAIASEGGSDADEGAPRRIDVVDAVSVASAGGRSCAALRAGTVTCWDADGDDPIRVPGVSRAKALALSVGHACAIVADGRVECWGNNDRGQLGAGAAQESSEDPLGVVGLRGVTSVAASAWSTCAIDGNEALWCWGDATFGQLGDGERTDPRLQPVAVEAPGRAESVAVGLFHACASYSDGSVWCWGANGEGQLGDGSSVDSSEPVRIVVPE